MIKIEIKMSPLSSGLSSRGVDHEEKYEWRDGRDHCPNAVLGTIVNLATLACLVRYEELVK